MRCQVIGHVDSERVDGIGIEDAPPELPNLLRVEMILHIHVLFPVIVQPVEFTDAIHTLISVLITMNQAIDLREFRCTDSGSHIVNKHPTTNWASSSPIWGSSKGV
jgi:hypothetical protein